MPRYHDIRGLGNHIDFHAAARHRAVEALARRDD